MSESLIKYDLQTQKTDKPIPFDRAFTLMVTKFPFEKVDFVEGYETVIEEGERNLKVDSTFIIQVVRKDGTKKDSVVELSFRDIILNHKLSHDTLTIFFRPLKPNKEFDVGVAAFLGKTARAALMDVNVLLADSKADIKKIEAQYNETVLPILKDKDLNRRFGLLLFSEYKALYAKFLAKTYSDLLNGSTFRMSVGLNLSDIQAVDTQTIKDLSNFKDAALLVELVQMGKWKEFELGRINIRKIFDPSLKEVDALDLDGRIENFKSNALVLDSLLARVDRVISKSITSTTPPGAGVPILFKDIRDKIIVALSNTNANSAIMQSSKKLINNVFDETKDLRQTFFLVGSTVASDLKAKGGNLLFLDLGLTNIVVPKLTGGMDFIPKPYYGVSIYFRPIDKNTRRGSFPGSHPKRKKPGDPDYNIVTKRGLAQHLALNIGFTMGSMSGDYDNFYNNTSLLVGPSIRFARAFKFSAGYAFLKQTSKDPLVSEKKVITGTYMSLSVDVDVVQGIKDVTSLIWK